MERTKLEVVLLLRRVDKGSRKKKLQNIWAKIYKYIKKSSSFLSGRALTPPRLSGRTTKKKTFFCGIPNFLVGKWYWRYCIVYRACLIRNP